jgi:membrane glycosyltransferase
MKKDDWKDSALHYAAARGDLATVQVLLAYGADANPINAHGATPADLARKRKHQSLADYLAGCASGITQPPLPQEVEGWKLLSEAKSGSEDDLESGSQPDSGKTMKKRLSKEEDAAWRAARARAKDGLGAEGTRMKPYTKMFRFSAVIMQFASLVYLAWRGARTLVPTPASDYAYSLIFYVFELCFLPLSFVFIISLWKTIDRPSRWAGDMLPKDKLPHVDVYIVRYSEEVDILEPTVIAALNMNWPGDKLTVHILDDGAGKDVLKMVRRLRYQLTSMKREARLVYVARRRVPGVPHHAKAGNINHAILRSQGTGEFIMVLDTDMIAHPNFLQKTIGHFYQRSSSGTDWVQKKRIAFIQTPQDFWNVPPSDPMVHCARFFY